jgi:hypothetical protein
MNQNNPNLLFYSKKCKTCELFINTCHNNNVLRFLKLICVDENINVYVSKGIKVVPTLIIQGHNNSIEGKNVFNWLEKLLLSIKSNNSNNSNNELPFDYKQQVVQTNIVKRNKIEEPISNLSNNNVKNKQQTNQNNSQQTNQNGGGQAAQNGGGQAAQNGGQQANQNNGPTIKKSPFGYLKDEMDGFSDSFAYLMSDNPLPKSYTTIDKEQAIYTAPEGNKLDKKTQEMLIKTLESDRISDKNEIERFYESEHNKIMNNNISNKNR